MSDEVVIARELTADELRAVLERTKRDLEYRSQRLVALQVQIDTITDKLSENEWFDSGIDKDEVLKDLCEILEHEPLATVHITATVELNMTAEVNLLELDQFDASMYLEDALSIDSSDGTLEIDRWSVENADWEAR